MVETFDEDRNILYVYLVEIVRVGKIDRFLNSRGYFAILIVGKGIRCV